jgi:hypothetical protein
MRRVSQSSLHGRGSDDIAAAIGYLEPSVSIAFVAVGAA